MIHSLYNVVALGYYDVEGHQMYSAQYYYYYCNCCIL